MPSEVLLAYFTVEAVAQLLAGRLLSRILSPIAILGKFS